MIQQFLKETESKHNMLIFKLWLKKTNYLSPSHKIN